MSAENTGVKKEISRRELLAMVSPFGKVTMAGECTGCGLCVPECPTGALNIKIGEENRLSLLFRQQRCTACNACVEICPEKCLKLEKSLTPAGAETPPAVLFEDEVARCAGCGKPYATLAMVAAVKRKLAGVSLPDVNYELCPECKTRARQGLMGK